MSGLDSATSWLEIVANCAAILTAAVAVFAYGKYRWDLRSKRIQLEEFLRTEKAKGGTVLLADPLLATGDSAIACLDRLKQFGVSKIKMLCLLVSQEGLARVQYFHPDVEIYALCTEEALDAEGNLLPGLGDAGNRLYNTK